MLSAKYCSFARDLLKLFVENAGELYGQEIISYNLHATVHLADEVRLHGPLHNISAFVFENYLDRIKKLIRKPQAPLQQIVRRMSEQRFGSSQKESGNLQKEHFEGPLPTTLSMLQKQYKEHNTQNFKITVFNKDNCAIINGSVAIVRNFVESKGCQFVIFQTFANCEPFFTYPASSSDFEIFSVSCPRKKLEIASLAAISNKCVQLSRNGKNVAIPLLHCK